MSLPNLESTSKTVETNEIDVFGPRIRFLTALSDRDGDYCLIKGTVPAGVVVPIHSHPERETFCVLEGEVQALWEDHWITLGDGDVLDVPGGLEHGWRNVTGAPVSQLVVVPMRLGRFFRDIGRPAATVPLGPPTLKDIERLVEIAQRYGYWTGSPADNAAVGLSFG